MRLLLLLVGLLPLSYAVLCPDSQTRCDFMKTCCQLKSGGYGCCPTPNAVCCSDDEHCCPSGYTCDVSEGTCNKGVESLPWLEKETGEVVGDVPCSDGKHYCNDNYTCCSFGGAYGCCPPSHAVCCKTGKFCCPEGYSCEEGNQCSKESQTIPGLMSGDAPLRSVICPGGSSECPDGNTCCQLPSGEWGCCPLPNAECCSDHVHCCPSGYTCDPSGGTCNKGDEVISWFEKTEAADIGSVVCPGGASECPDGNTCCLLSSGEWGCCPLPNAVCCSDHLHCCPSGYTCDTSSGACNKGDDVISWFEKTEATKVGSVICPDGQVECPEGSTCCKLVDGYYGCCPLPKAVCCKDEKHCCPNGYTCSPSSSSCNKGDEVIQWFEKTQAIRVGSVVCPGGSSECPDGNTCCQLSGGQWGCCPLPNAVCCSDHLHCCPSGYTCDTSSGACNKGGEVISWFEKTEAMKVGSVICPDGQSECPDGNTCCMLASGGYGCCPLPNAECCSDHAHCCPSGYTCDPSGGTCNKGDEVISWFEKTEATKVGSVVCPGGSSECPDGNTCCQLSGGELGCCPLPNAVCCSDHLHCCPSGYTCDTSSGACNKGGEVISWFEKTEATKVGSVICPDGQSECPDGNTCCMLASGGYGCCPLPNAECCSDHAHCCPSGYTCDPSGGTCNKGDEVISWFEKTEATKVGSVVCPGGSSECPDGNTCCQLSGGELGCCPLPNAVCCSDHLHCCPSGYTCDTSSGACNKGGEVISWFEKTEATKVGSVICPDGQSECPDGNTCCMLASGGYGCCPLPNAECCSDHVHCCPSGYTCDPSGGTCNKGDEVISWFEKTEATKDGSVVCPGGSSECPDGNTCCQLSGGEWGCCPLPNAVCCSDHLHCCPNGYTCDTASGACNKGDEVINWFEKTVATKVGSVICPDGQSECPDGNTCCMLASGGYGCCPLPNAECCSDHVHCCPSGYTCDPSGGTCNKGGEVISWFEKTEATKVGSVVCPGGSSECPDGNTCCKLESGQWGCCPLPNAECCSDHIHCCPSGYTCDPSGGTCSKGDEVINWFEKTEATNVGSVLCPDGASECPDGNTCCKLSSGEWGCCPLPNAVCCSDHLHCCPSGYTCDTASGACNKGDELISWFEKTEAKKVGSVICPDGQSECPDGNTCCMLASGGYGCCPLPNAECCSDHVHCCPSGYTCDPSGGTCNKGDEVINWFEKTEAKKVGSVICPDGQSECPDGNTCCQLSSGQWGRCPLPNAECCSDHIHCCPSGYACDPSGGTCNKGDEVISWFEKTEATNVGSVVCPGGSSECPDGNTCCQLSSGEWGCCPLPNAVCCSDHLHCCPNGYTCDTASGACSKGDEVIDWFEKTEAKKVGSVICPDGQSECPDGNTCCRLSSGQWGCCPLPNAECCSDHIHCCPSGYTCDPSGGTCSKGDEVINWFEKTEATNVGSVLCPDGASECPDGNTCCKLSSGEWGCCPLPNAVCCSDHLHCCPSGYTCDTVTGACNKGDEVISWFKKTEAKKVGSVICPDGQSECPDGNTCCMLASGGYGCCPLPNAECCSDHIHCCPSGYTCDPSGGTCNKGEEIISWFEKTEAKKFGNVVCPGGTSECPDGNTCCQLSSGQWGCCPLPNAVCCSDHLHCCPSRYTCDTSSGACNKGDEVISWFEKTEATKPRSVICKDGQMECPEGSTCCKLVDGYYGCCPLPKAVCCKDMIHCCPEGYTCGPSGGTCNKGDEVINWFEKTEATKVGSVVCPGGSSECPDGNTCCQLSSGQWGCCPLPNAVCCSDHLHCCPSGYTCDTASGACNKGDEVISWFEKTEAKKVGSVVCPGGSSECPDGNTCCQLSSGQWGCCPLPNAVCCSDHLHCCPSGYTCDTASGECSIGDEVINWFEKTEAKQVGNVVCPGGSSECPDGNTCCQLSSGQWGCCPLTNAVCCSDHLHCCPSGYTCDTASGACNKGDEVINWFEKTEAKQVGSVICPDGQSECPDGNTCCQLSSGQWGCCPLPNAVCCSDHLHCCPSGYTCDTSSGACNKGDEVISWFEKTEAKKVGSVVCPGGTSECPDGNTCCQLSSGQWGCCPLPNAVCCSDHLHCCPSGYTCDTSSGACNKGNEVISWFEKTEATSTGSVVCPGSYTKSCPDGTTCCPLLTGQWQCCPIPNAVCCRDHVHCCPSGYTCDSSEGTCNQGDEVISWFEKTEAINVQSVVCSGGQSECPDGNTCCPLASGQWGCCPLPNAVCCSDHLHCCPSGYTCDTSSGACNKGDEVISWFEKTEAKKVGNVVCPGGSSECPDGNTCCQLASGEWGCCPLTNAVCCSDHLHCCPSGYTCDTSSGACNKGYEVISWFEKTEAKRAPGSNLICPDGSECHSDNTCCQMSNGRYGCCPMANAECCADEQHCCPAGYKCNPKTRSCTRGKLFIDWVEKIPSLPGKQQNVGLTMITCPDNTTICPPSSTCCPGTTGYTCCPTPHATCCDDKVHCCPEDFECFEKSTMCRAKDGTSLGSLKKLPGVKKHSLVQCKDGNSCPENNTCCIESSGSYGCCPLPKATCCPDKIHCCPNGFKCYDNSSTCLAGDLRVRSLKKFPSSMIRPLGGEFRQTCKDNKSHCPDEFTCCKVRSGSYECCPEKDAVCCDDKQHCCPSGYKCDTVHATCRKGSTTIDWLKKVPALPTLGDITCPDLYQTCPSNSTCCRITDDLYGCCPYANAVCCDSRHCCPNGFTCDLATGTCSNGHKTIPFAKKFPTKK